jgi:hypothetical protein
MTKIQLDLPSDIEKALALYSVEKDIRDKRKSIVKILRHHFQIKEAVKIN